MGCCKENSLLLVSFVNIVFFFAGVSIAGLSIFALIELKGELATVPKYIPYVALGVGILVMFCGILGFFGAQCQDKCALFMFFLTAAVLTGIVLAAGIVLLVSTGRFDDGKAESAINDFEMAVFRDCCVGAGFALEEAPLCVNVIHPSQFACIFDQSRYLSFNVNTAFCKALEKVEIDDLQLVGEPPSGCSSPEAFSDSLGVILERRIMPLGITLAALAGVLLLCIVASCVLLCSNKQEDGDCTKGDDKKLSHAQV